MITMNEEKKILKTLKPLKDRLPLKSLHNMFGVCFDKPETYTVYEVPINEIKNPLTITNVLKSVGINFTNKKETIICFSFNQPNYYYCNGATSPIVYFNVTFCNTSMNKTVLSFGGDYLYTKKDVLPILRRAIEIVVIEADRDSLKHSENQESRDYDRHLSAKFNEDHTMYDRVQLVGNYSLTDKEVMEKPTFYSLSVQIRGTNKKFMLSKTIGTLYENKWGEIIDKSGYNRNAFQVHQHFKLQEFKADKVRKLIKSGATINLQSFIVLLFHSLKNEISNALLSFDFPDQYEINEINWLLNDYKSYLISFNSIRTRIEQVGTPEEYTPHTMDIVSDLERVKSKLLELIDKAKKLQEKGE